MDALSGEPFKGAILSFAPNMNGDSTDGNKAKNCIYVKKTADKGGFNTKSLPSGIYNVTIKKTGYVDQIVKISVADGDLTEFNVSLSKN